jgi:hypothetical protein
MDDADRAGESARIESAPPQCRSAAESTADHRGRRWDGYADYGCQVNAITVEALFERYARTRFMYDAKRAHLAPHLAEVSDNWRRALRGGELIHWVATYQDPETDGWASITSWRSTPTGWQTQHLVSTGGPVASRAVMLAGQAVRIAEGLDSSHQNWFQRSNRFASMVFGTFADTARGDTAALIDYELLALPRHLDIRAEGSPAGSIERGDTDRALALARLARLVRGPVFVTAEELNPSTLHLDATDELYQLVGLRRYRRVWMLEQAGEAMGAVLCYRGPLGFNFSFLENRCDLIVRSDLSDMQRHQTAAALLKAAQPAYADLSLGYVPVVTDAVTASAVRRLGGTPVRAYCQSIWLREAFQAWYDHVDHLYAQRLGRFRPKHPEPVCAAI